MSDFVVTGADDFLRLSKVLKATGQTELRKELNKSVRAAVKPAQRKAADALAAALPGRLSAKGRRVTQRVQARTGRDPGVTVGVPYKRGGKSGLGYSNARMVNQKGLIRHPVYGNRSRWANTRVGGLNWFDGTYQSEAPAIRQEIQGGLERIADKVVRSA